MIKSKFLAEMGNKIKNCTCKFYSKHTILNIKKINSVIRGSYISL